MRPRLRICRPPASRPCPRASRRPAAPPDHSRNFVPPGAPVPGQSPARRRGHVVLPCLSPGHRPGDPEEHRPGEHHSFPSYTVHIIVNIVHSQRRASMGAGMAGQQAAEADALWFNPPGGGESGRRALTRERVVAEALAVIAADGAQSLSMRTLAARLGVVPGALYRHVRGKEQLYDLILDAVLGEVDCRADPGAPWAAQVAALARRLRAVLENHPGTAALLKTRDP